MMECPICGAQLKKCHGTFEMQVDELVLRVPDSDWEECNHCGEIFINATLSDQLLAQKYLRELK